MAETPANELDSTRPTPPPPPKRKSGKAKRFAILFLVSAVGLGAWWLMAQRRAASQTTGAAESDAATAVLPLESFTVNLADQEDGRFLRITIALGVSGQLPALGKSQSKGLESSAVSMAVIRDSILTVLAQCKSADLLTPEGKTKLKTDLLAALNRDVPALQVREVYFTDFVVQR